MKLYINVRTATPPYCFLYIIFYSDCTVFIQGTYKMLPSFMLPCFETSHFRAITCHVLHILCVYTWQRRGHHGFCHLLQVDSCTLHQSLCCQIFFGRKTPRNLCFIWHPCLGALASWHSLLWSVNRWSPSPCWYSVAKKGIGSILLSCSLLLI